MYVAQYTPEQTHADHCSRAASEYAEDICLAWPDPLAAEVCRVCRS